MLLAVAVVIFILWLLGFFAFHIAGALIHILLIIAIIAIIIYFVQGRRAA
ncbi:MAG: lmo0937 family membrane protein [Thermomicrobiales bacterium]